MTTLFISDLHLDESRPATVRAFFHFLDTTARDADALYILGDFFEAWVGDDDDAPFARQIIDRLARYTASGQTLFFMVGNRDFLIGERFAAETGATLLADPTVVDLNGEAVLLMHGDSLCTRDTEYMAFRLQARNPLFQQGLLSKSLAERRLIAQQLRQQSQSMNSLKADDIMDVTPADVISEMTKHGVTTLIHGHTHRPACHEFDLNGQPAQRWVLGDWCESLWWISANDNGLTLHQQPLTDA